MADDSSRTLWLGDLPFWADENYVFNLFASTGAVVSCKIIRNKVTNLSEGYGFVEFRTHEAAEQVPPSAIPLHMAVHLRGFLAARRVSTRRPRGFSVYHVRHGAVSLHRTCRIARRCAEATGGLSHVTASSQVLNTYNGCPIPNTDQLFRLNWAAFGVGKGSADGASVGAAAADEHCR